MLRSYKQVPSCAHSWENLVLKIFALVFDFLQPFLLCPQLAEVLSEVLSPPQLTVKVKEAAGAPRH